MIWVDWKARRMNDFANALQKAKMISATMQAKQQATQQSQGGSHLAMQPSQQLVLQNQSGPNITKETQLPSHMVTLIMGR